MKIFFRLFFKTVRLILGPFMLLWERLARPKSIERSAVAQARIDTLTSKLALYQYKTCPFCIKTRLHIARLGLAIEKRDAQHNAAYRAELEQQGGKIKVPCLRITDAHGQHTWLYESNAIIRHLDELADFS